MMRNPSSSHLEFPILLEGVKKKKFKQSIIYVIFNISQKNMFLFLFNGICHITNQMKHFDVG